MRRIYFTLVDGKEDTAKILFATDSVLFLVPADFRSFNPTKGNYFHLLKAQNIQSIWHSGTANWGMTFLTYSLGAAGMLAGLRLMNSHKDDFQFFAVVAGVISLAVGMIAADIDALFNAGRVQSIQGDIDEYRKNFNALKSYSIFPNLPPPEIEPFIH